uniref:Uncharacterized protein n=1 Tax=Graphocephala atropunctata TaxID=36148 RepID=A0A1B6LW68_9HEMI
MGSPHYYLKLSQKVKFEAVSRARLNNVFFDECNNQVFSVQSGDMTEVVVRCPDLNVPRIFQMQEKGPVISIKFNPAQNILAVQRTHSCVEFINFDNGEQSSEYSQNCRSRNAKILGFIWISASEIIYVTDQGVELYQVEMAKSVVKMTKSLAMTVNWFLFCHRTSILLMSSGTLCNTIQPIFLKQGNLHKLSRFEIEPSGAPKPQKLTLERDAMIGIIYEQPRVLVLRHQSSKTSQGAEVVIYTIKKMSTVKKTHVLKLGRSGRFALSVVDNLIFVHHQASKTSLMFDIELDAECDGSIFYHSPVMPPQPIREDTPDLYSSNWITFPLNIVIDAKLGCLWYLELDLEHVDQLVHTKCYLINFLMLRSNSKGIILRVLSEATQNQEDKLEELATVFDSINTVYRSDLVKSVACQLGSPVAGPDLHTTGDTLEVTRVVVDQSDMYTNVLSRLADYTDENSAPRKRKFAIWVLLEYVRSLTDHQIPVQHYLHELVINSLVLHKAYYQLHQLLQYFVVSDSKPLACLLLSLENLYPAAHQLALDMLQRLSTANQEITEVLLSKHQILPALRYIH